MSAPLWIKICGLRTVEAIGAAAQAGADAVGFVFHESSPRHLEPSAARDLVATVPAGLAKVAVFRHPSQTLVDAALDAIRPDWVQTDAEDLAALRLPAQVRILPVYRTAGDVVARVTSRPAAWRRFLVESAQSGAAEVADWRAATALAGAGELVLAGGLETGNVVAALAAVQPFGVDVSSGVESSRGVKDAARIRAFIAVARALSRGVAIARGLTPVNFF